ncbi:hypothetical protein GCM10025762_12910 [Haloechinothrix salitolerans]
MQPASQPGMTQNHVHIIADRTRPDRAALCGIGLGFRVGATTAAHPAGTMSPEFERVSCPECQRLYRDQHYGVANGRCGTPGCGGIARWPSLFDTTGDHHYRCVDCCKRIAAALAGDYTDMNRHRVLGLTRDELTRESSNRT